MIRRPPRSTLFPTRRSSDLGPTYEIHNGELFRFRCRVGHAYTAESLLEEKSEVLEGALYLARSEEHTSELQSRQYLVCRLLLEKKQYALCSRSRPRYCTLLT